MSKYNSRKTTVDGITFDSKKEARRYLVLKQMEQDGEIKNLRLQVPVELVPSFEIVVDISDLAEQLNAIDTEIARREKEEQCDTSVILSMKSTEQQSMKM